MGTIVEDGRDGFLVRPADVHSLSTLLIQVFSDQLPAREIGESARNKILNLFDMEKMVKETIEAYRRTLFSTGLYERPKPASSRRQGPRVKVQSPDSQL